MNSKHNNSEENSTRSYIDVKYKKTVTTFFRRSCHVGNVLGDHRKVNYDLYTTAF